MQDTPVQTQQSDKAASSVLAFPLVARLLALGGAALFAVAAWLPWVIGVMSQRGTQQAGHPPGVRRRSTSQIRNLAVSARQPLDGSLHHLCGGQVQRRDLLQAVHETILTGLPADCEGLQGG